MAIDFEHVRRHGSGRQTERRLDPILGRRGLAIALTLLMVGCTSSETQTTSAAGGEAIHYQLSLGTAQGQPIFMEGDTSFANDQFTISRPYEDRWIQMAGNLDGKAMKVTGSYGANYMSGEATSQNNAFVIVLNTTGNLTSAVVTLSVPPSVAARLAAP